MENISERIKNDLTAPSSYTDGANIIECCNHIDRRNFRMWIDGNYADDGYQTYQHNIERINAAYPDRKKMRAFVINQFTSYIAHEYACSYGHAQKSIVAAFSTWELKQLTDELITDAIDLISDTLNVIDNPPDPDRLSEYMRNI